MFLAVFMYFLIHVIVELNSTEFHLSLPMYQLQHALIGKNLTLLSLHDTKEMLS